jgi:hypothetical protein
LIYEVLWDGEAEFVAFLLGLEVGFIGAIYHHRHSAWIDTGHLLAEAAMAGAV